MKSRMKAYLHRLRKRVHYPFILVWLACLPLTDIVAQNPIICDRYTPDPAPYVHGDTLYLFVDHDEDVTENGYFTMKDWLLYSTVDMVNWTYHYLFYHNGKLPEGGGYKRATCIEEYTPNADGTIPFITATTTGVNQLQHVNPYVRQEAETINQSQGVRCEGDYNGCYVRNLSSSNYIKVRGVDFGAAGAQSLTVRLRVEKKGTLLVRTGSSSSTAIGRIPVEPTNGEWQEYTCELTTPITGVRNLFFSFSGRGTLAMDFDWWQFSEEPTAIREVQNDTNANTTHGTYDLSGRRVNEDAHSKGIRIVDGKKMIYK